MYNSPRNAPEKKGRGSNRKQIKNKQSESRKVSVFAGLLSIACFLSAFLLFF